MRGLNNLKLTKKLPAIIVLCALISSTSIMVLTTFRAKDALVAAQTGQLEALREARTKQLADYLGSIEEDLLAVADNPFTLSALRAYNEGWNALSSNQTQTLQKLYITGNPNPTGEKEKLDAASDGSKYSDAHATYHPWFRSFLYAREYYDIFLFNLEGDLIYSVFKELDYATNLNTGEWKETDLGNAFRAAQRNGKAGEKFFFDFRPYAPSYDAPASFISTPIVDEKGVIEGVLVFQMPISRINHIMQASAGMGESGETYIVGSDYLMRSDSRFSKESTILKTRVEGATTKAALAGGTGVEIVPDYRGIPVVSAYVPLQFLGTTWAIMAEIDEAEMLQPVIDMRNQAAIASLLLASIIVAVGMYFSRMITSPIIKITDAMRSLSDGNATVEVPETQRKDELGDMAHALLVFKENAAEVNRLKEEQEVQARAAESDKAAAMSALANQLEEAVGGVVATVGSAVGKMQNSAQSMSKTSERTIETTKAVFTATEEAKSNVETVSMSASDLNNSINEISQQVSQSSEITKRAVGQAESTNATVRGLAEAGQKIGEVINLINDIASQTNLLALNATIEAARAGEAGKGFAVVASEVKSLATQTAKATDEIAAQIAGMQEITDDTVNAIEGITTTISEVNEIADAIAAAVQQQGTATQAIARNVNEAAQGAQNISQNVNDVTQATEESGISAQDMLASVDELKGQSDILRSEIDSFLKEIRAA